MQANKNPKFQIKDNEAHLYHILAIVKLNDEKKKEYKSQEHILTMTEREFRMHKEHGHILGFDSEEIIHDPTLKGKKAGPTNVDNAGRAKAEKNLAKLNAAKLTEKYIEVMGEEPADDLTKEGMITEILKKLYPEE